MINHVRKWRMVTLMAAIVVVAALVLAACGEEEATNGGTTGDTGQPKAGGTYNFPLSANPIGIEPVLVQENQGWLVAYQVFEGLVRYELQDDGSMLAVPAIAEEWEPNEDASVWTFHLKKGVMFQPPVSREVKAQDFVDSWTRATDPANESFVSYIMAPIEGVGDDGYWATEEGTIGAKAIDDYTLEVTLKYPFGEFPQTLGHIVASATPAEYIEEVGVEQWRKKPIGTGPFMVEEWVDNQNVELVKNPDYWDKDNAAWVDRVHMPIITDTNTEWLEFKKGSLDYTEVPPGQVKAAENDPKATSGEWLAKKWPSLSTYWIGFDWTDPVVGEPAGEAGLKLRQALTYSADQEAVINVVKEGVGLPATGIVPVGIPGFVKDQNPYPYDPEKAKQLISEVGEVPTLNYWYNTDLGHQKVAEALQAGWKNAGIDVKLSNFEWGTFIDKLSKADQAEDVQIFRMGWIADYPSMDNFLYGLFHSEISPVTSLTFYDNPEFDQLVTQARQTADEQERTDLYREAEKLLLTDAPIINVYFYQDFRVMNTRVQGQVHDPMGLVAMWKVWVK